MGPTITLDKSVLQALSAKEIEALHRHYSPFIVPVLAMEILADLKKYDRSEEAREAVVKLAKKLQAGRSPVNVHYTALVAASLCGQPVEMRGVPVLPAGKTVRDDDGKSGLVLGESPQERAIHRWRESKFDEAEQALAEQWRSSTLGFDLESFKADSKSAIPKLTGVHSLKQLRKRTCKFLSHARVQNDLLSLCSTLFVEEEESRRQLEIRWKFAPDRCLSRFAPYAYHCLEVVFLFYWALALDLIGTRPTNFVDMEYLFYIPFCMVFSSGDKLHKKTVPLFLRGDQDFVEREVLKRDLQKLAEFWDRLSVEGRHKYIAKRASRPPESPRTFTLEIWEKRMRPHRDVGGDRSATMKPEQLAKLREFITRKVHSEEVSPTSESSEPSFIARKFTMRRDDPCPCGSGIPFDECHGKEM